MIYFRRAASIAVISLIIYVFSWIGLFAMSMMGNLVLIPIFALFMAAAGWVFGISFILAIVFYVIKK